MVVHVESAAPEFASAFATGLRASSNKQEVVSVRLSPDNNEVLRLKTRRDAGAP